MQHRNGIFTVACLAVLSQLGSACSSNQRMQAAGPEVVSGVEVMMAQRTAVPDYLEAVGTVRAAQTSQLASQIMGNIVALEVREGERVQRGQVLAVIDDAQLRATVEQAAATELAARNDLAVAESELALAESTLKRYERLYEKQQVSTQQFDEVKARSQAAEARRDMSRATLERASAALEQAKTLLSYTQIRAPFAGVITERKVDPGTLAAPGLAVLTLEDTRSYRLEVTVDERDVHLVRVGKNVTVQIDALGNEELAGKVVQMVPAANPESRSFLVKVQLPIDARLRSGLFGRAQFSRGERQALLIPRSAIVSRGQLQGVYVVDAQQIAGLRYVTVGGANTGEEVEVLSGLDSGEKLITAPGGRELGGKRVLTRP